MNIFSVGLFVNSGSTECMFHGVIFMPNKSNNKCYELKVKNSYRIIFYTEHSNNQIQITYRLDKLSSRYISFIRILKSDCHQNHKEQGHVQVHRKVTRYYRSKNFITSRLNSKDPFICKK